MAVLPSGLTFGQIQWTVMELNAITTVDPDVPIDIAGLTGSCTIKASVAPVLVQTGSPHETMFLGPWVFPIVNGVLQDAKGNAQINLPATDCAIFNPNNFTYSASFILSDGKTRGSFSFSLATGAVVDFTDITPVPDASGTYYIRGAQGPVGATGPQGPAGLGSDDGSVSSLVNNTSTQTYNAVTVAALSVVQSADVNPLGAWNFAQAPTINGVVIGTGGSGGSVSDATTSAKGIVQLAGDLGGTAAAPTVPGLAGKAALVHGHVSTQITDASTIGLQVLTATDAPTLRGYIGAGTSNLVIGTTTGTAKDGAWSPPDATNVIKGLVTLSGDLGGTATAPTVPGLAGKAALVHTHTVSQLSASGTLDSSTFLRGDGVWAVPPGGTSSVTLANLPANTLVYQNQNSDGTWPNRPTSRTDMKCIWTRVVAGSANPAAATSPAVNGAYSNDVVVGA